MKYKYIYIYICVCMYVCTMYVCIYKSNDCENEKNVEEKKNHIHRSNKKRHIN